MYFDPAHPCPSHISSQPIKPPSNFVSFLSVPLFVKLGRENKTGFSPRLEASLWFGAVDFKEVFVAVYDTYV